MLNPEKPNRASSDGRDLAPGQRGLALDVVLLVEGGEDLAKAIACRGSTKFGEEMSREALEKLLWEWAAAEFGEVCPHGRPIVKRVGLADLLREFGRV
jgi:DNA mismatch repair ATPase MutL